MESDSIQCARVTAYDSSGNGDVFTPEDFKKRLNESGVDYIMIARGAMTNPYIFKQISNYLEKGKYDSKDKIEQFFELVELLKKYKISFPQIKNHAVQFTKGLAGSTRTRGELTKCKTVEDIENVLKN